MVKRSSCLLLLLTIAPLILSWNVVSQSKAKTSPNPLQGISESSYLDLLKREAVDSWGENEEAVEPTFLVFMSQSIPLETWGLLSHEVSKLKGSFVLKGINDLSALSTFSGRANLCIDPLLFKKYQVDAVPTFVVVDGEKFDKVTGLVTVSYALESMSVHGETEEAKQLYRRLVAP